MAHTRRPLATISIHNNTNDLGPVDLYWLHQVETRCRDVVESFIVSSSAALALSCASSP